MKKTVLINLNTTWNIYNFRLNLIKSLQIEGYKVVALAPLDKFSSELESIGVKCYNIKLNQKGTNPFTDFILFINYLRLFIKIKPSLILSYTIKPNLYGNFAARILKIKTINNISGLGTLFFNKNFTFYFGKLLYKLSLKSSSHVFFQNDDDRNLFLKLKLAKTNISSVIPGSGVDVGIFNQIKKTNRGEKFLFVGRLIGDKGIYEFLEAAKEILNIYPNKEFLIAGELGYNNRTALTRTMLDEYLSSNDQIKYLGNSDNIIDILRNVDVVVLPSYREGLSKSLVEAASMSLPIITTDVPGCRDVVEHNHNGLLCKSKSVKSLVKCIVEIINLSDLNRREMGRKGREIAVAKFNENIVINQYLKIIGSLKI